MTLKATYLDYVFPLWHLANQVQNSINCYLHTSFPVRMLPFPAHNVRACGWIKGKVWSKMKLHRLVVCAKDRQYAIFLKDKKDFLTFPKS